MCRVFRTYRLFGVPLLESKGWANLMKILFACNLKYRDNDPEDKAARLVSYWQEEIQKPSWRPFTNTEVDEEDKVSIQFPYSIHALTFL